MRQLLMPQSPTIVVVDDRFPTVRRVGVILIVLQAVILGYVSGARLFPAIVIGSAFAIGVTRRRLQLDRVVLQLLCWTIAIGFVLYFLVSPFPIPVESLFLRTPLAHTVARFLICMQLLAVAVRHESGRPPIWLAGLGAMCLPFATNAHNQIGRAHV